MGLGNGFVFISYSRDDLSDVKKLSDDLQKQGFAIWIDQHGLTPATINWELAIKKAVKSAHAFLLMASPTSCESPYVRHELAIAEISGCPIYVVWIAGDEWAESVPMGYYSRQRIDARADGYTSALQQITKIFQEDFPETIQQPSTDKKHVYLSYNYDSDKDLYLAHALEVALAESGYSYSIDDLTIPLGTHGAQHIHEEIERSDYFITLLSEESVNSEVLRAEIEYIQELNILREYPLKILPVRVSYRHRFPYYLQQYLNQLAWTLWDDDTDTPLVIDDIMSALAGGELRISSIQDKAAIIQTREFEHLQQPRPYADPKHSDVKLVHDSGTISPFSQFYIDRKCDHDLLDALEKREGTVVIKAPRQIGKSSLLIRGCHIAQDMGYRVAFLDFQLLDIRTMHNEERLVKTFCRQIVEALDLDVPDIGDKWKDDMGAIFQCTAYFKRYILRKIGDSPLLLAIDEIDHLFTSPFRSDFFGMLRNWHNNRAYDKKWQGFSQILVISTEPYMLIENLNQSPFNVGQVISLDDFEPEQIDLLNVTHSNLLSANSLETLYDLTGGHPYLTREAMYQLAMGRLSLDVLIDEAASDHGPFADHLRHFLFLLNRNPDLQAAFLQIIHKHGNPPDTAIARLQSAGLVKRDNNGLRARCQLYSHYFASRLQGND